VLEAKLQICRPGDRLGTSGGSGARAPRRQTRARAPRGAAHCL